MLATVPSCIEEVTPMRIPFALSATLLALVVAPA